MALDVKSPLSLLALKIAFCMPGPDMSTWPDMEALIEHHNVRAGREGCEEAHRMRVPVEWEKIERMMKRNRSVLAEGLSIDYPCT